MPDRYGDPEPAEPEPMSDELWAAQQRAHAADTRALSVVGCQLCDDDGYRGSTVCDHVDHASETEHGRALVRAELEKIRQRKAGAK